MSKQAWDYDVIIIGGGGAGIAAAIEALDAGARVLLCEAAQRIGGSAANSGGVILAAGSDIQKAKGIEDSVDELYNWYMAVNQYKVEPALVRRLCEGGVPTLDWLRSFGVTFNPDALYVAGVESPNTPRGHPADGQGLAIMTALEGAARSRGLEVVLNTRVERLLTDDSGAICGIHADGADVSAPSVVITTGGFGNNFDMLSKYYTDVTKHGKDWHFYVGIDENLGDGIVLGQQVGASIVDGGTDRGNAMITASFSKEVEPYIPGWLIYVNKDGFRFIDETAGYVVMDLAVNAQPDSVCWAIMDHAAFTRSENDPTYKSKGFLDFPTPNWLPDALARHHEEGTVVSADTPEELGAKLGINPDALAATLAEYNRDAARKEDSHYLKPAYNLIPMVKPPFYAIELRAAGVGTTNTGLRIDREARVIGTHGRTIEGLYCAGECAGGIMRYYVGGGNSLLNNFVYGRVAGKNAALDAQKR
ncbi:MAG: FAD-dependent oxidoreductase [Porticoccaceae bacterium]